MGWKKGTSGNIRGRPKGTLNRSTLAAQQLLDGEAEILTAKVISLAKGGDVTALRICLDRILSPRKDRPIPAIELPPVVDPESVTVALNLVIQATACGKLTPSEAFGLAALLNLQLRATTEEPLAPPHQIVESEIVWRQQILDCFDELPEGSDNIVDISLTPST